MQDDLVSTLPGPARLRHHPHQANTVAVFLVLELERLREQVQFRRIGVRQRKRHWAMLRFEWDRQESMLGHEYVPEHGALEFGIVGDRAPGRRVGGGCKEGHRSQLPRE